MNTKPALLVLFLLCTHGAALLADTSPQTQAEVFEANRARKAQKQAELQELVEIREQIKAHVQAEAEWEQAEEQELIPEDIVRVGDSFTGSDNHYSTAEEASTAQAARRRNAADNMENEINSLWAAKDNNQFAAARYEQALARQLAIRTGSDASEDNLNQANNRVQEIERPQVVYVPVERQETSRERYDRIDAPWKAIREKQATEQAIQRAEDDIQREMDRKIEDEVDRAARQHDLLNHR